MPPRLTIIGLDAATFDVIDPLVEAGDLPNLARLLRSGAHGELRSTTHPLTPQAWSTMVTGVNAGQHGIWDFAERDESGYGLRVVNGSFRRAPAFWEHLTAAGRRVGLLNVPFTWPPPRVDGFSLSGFDTATHDEMSHPPELISEIERELGPLELDHRFPVGPDGRVDLDLVRRSCEQKTGLALLLAERFDPELLFVVFMSADHIHHIAWTDWEERGREGVVADVYRLLDEAVGRLVDGLEGGDFLVVSDHGGGSLDGVVNLNHWLAEHGFLTYRGITGESGRLLQRLLMLRRRLLPESARRRIKRKAPRLSERVARRSIDQSLDLARTRAFAYGTFGNVVLNVRGREAQGIVEPGEEYDLVRDEIAAGLLEIRAPDGRKIVRSVHRREDMFEGPQLDRVPDLIVEFEDYSWLGKGNLKGPTPTLWDTVQIEGGSEVSYVGSHRFEGILALAGPSAAAGVELSARIEDVAPTVLYLLGEAVPDNLEGRVLVEAIEPSLLDGRQPEYRSAGELELDQSRRFDEAETAVVESRLRGLGYLE
jgi:predicted AlkP superfamily phosphohydrolase/phosphomutase